MNGLNSVNVGTPRPRDYLDQLREVIEELMEENDNLRNELAAVRAMGNENEGYRAKRTQEILDGYKGWRSRDKEIPVVTKETGS